MEREILNKFRLLDDKIISSIFSAISESSSGRLLLHTRAIKKYRDSTGDFTSTNRDIREVIISEYMWIKG